MTELEEEILDDEIQTIIKIPESFIIQYATALEKENANNIFSQILNISNEFKKAGMTPIYLFDKSKMHFRLITAETYGKYLH